MTLKDKFLSIKTYEEYEPIRREFDGLDFSDKEVREHFGELFYIPPELRAVDENGLQILVREPNEW